MSNDKRYKVLIVEDDLNYSAPMQLAISRSEDFSVLAVTDKADEAYKLVRTGLPDVAIVDLEISAGSGLELLAKIRETEKELAIRPYLLVVTNYGDKSKATEKVRDELGDFIIKKTSETYSPAEVLNHLRLMSNLFHRNRQPSAQQTYSEIETEELIRNRIHSELERYYMPLGNPARDYLAEALCTYIKHPNPNHLKVGKVYALIGAQHKKEPQAVDKAIRRFLNAAFDKTDTEDIKQAYTPYIDIGRGVPTNRDFILHTADKIRREKIF